MTADHVAPPPNPADPAAPPERERDAGTSTPAWATVTITLLASEGPPSANEHQHLEDLGDLLAGDPDVGCVEHRSAATLPSPAPAALVLYTEPHRLPGVTERVTAELRAAGLTANVTPQVHAGEDWREEWKRHYRPRIFGDGTLLVRPSWLERPPDAPERELVIDPGRAFGTGLHETTELCLEWLCAAFRRGLAPRAMLDLGCGSGILSLAAAVLFPDLDEILAVDIDPEAATVTRENAELNGLGSRIVTRAGTLACVSGRFDLVLANIRPEVLIPISHQLGPHVRSPAQLVMSGILTSEHGRVAEPYRAAGWQLESSARRHDWEALVWQR